MALGGGKFTKFNKRLPGTYTRVITVGTPRNETDSGIVAGGIVSDWGPDDEIFSIDAQAFLADPVAITGYGYEDPKNQTLREVFKHANTLITYKLNNGGAKAQVDGVGEAKYNGKVGNDITVSVLKNILDESKYDVTTYFGGEERDVQTVPEAGIDEIVLTKGTEKSGTAVETATASFTFNKNQIKVTFANVPEGYKHSVRIRGQVGILAFTPGRMEEKEVGLTHTITYSPGAAINGEMTVEAVLTKDKITVINSCTYTCQLNEDVQVGADGTMLVANDFVEFAPQVILENAGYTFSGGRSGSAVQAANHSKFLSKLEGYSFNNLYYDGTEDAIKELYNQYTQRLRDERGIYFQTVLYDYAKADYEGIISIFNGVNGAETTATLTPWLAGYMSAIELNNEATNKVYDGELSINTDITQARLEALLDTGEFVFHNVTLDEVRTLEDVNTFRSFTEDKNEDISQNKVIRIVDRIHNRLAGTMNRLDIGTVSNTVEGRNTLWVRVDAILSELVNTGAIEAYDPSDIEVLPIEGQRNAVQINLNITVNGTIRRIYITTYVVR